MTEPTIPLRKPTTAASPTVGPTQSGAIGVARALVTHGTSVSVAAIAAPPTVRKNVRRESTREV